MKRNYLNCYLILLLITSACDTNDDQLTNDPFDEDLTNVTVEILPTGINELLDTDLIALHVSLTNSSGNSVNYSDIKWVSNHDGDLENSSYQDSYFLSANQHIITCTVTLSDTTEITQTIEINVTDDPRGSWEINWNYNGAGSDIYNPDELVLNTPNFIIFSNTEDPYRRLIISDFAEQVLQELQTLYQVSEFDFNGKVIIGHQKETGNGFVNTNPNFSMYIGMPESGFVPLNGSWNFNIEGIKHELMHLVELSYMLSSPTEYTSHRWFWEGIAVLVSNGTRVTTLEELVNWQNTNGENPISIQEQPNGSTSSDGEYYPMYGLSVAYLMDSNGLGKSYTDIMDMYEAIQEGATFEAAFFTHFGITVNEYETSYFKRMENYLP